MYSVPRSMPRTAEAAEAVDAKIKKSARMRDRLESRRRPWGGIVGWGVDGEVGGRFTKESKSSRPQLGGHLHIK